MKLPIAGFSQDFERQIPIALLADEDGGLERLLAVKLGVRHGRREFTPDVLISS